MHASDRFWRHGAIMTFWDFMMPCMAMVYSASSRGLHMRRTSYDYMDTNVQTSPRSISRAQLFLYINSKCTDRAAVQNVSACTRHRRAFTLTWTATFIRTPAKQVPRMCDLASLRVPRSRAHAVLIERFSVLAYMHIRIPVSGHRIRSDGTNMILYIQTWI